MVPPIDHVVRAMNGRHIGMVLPMEAARERYVVVSPDDETTAPQDEFN
jgi:hypothetical protein